MKYIYLDFYDIKVSVHSNSEYVLESLKRDFAYFLKDILPSADISIEAVDQRPPWETVPQVRASLYLAGAIAYDRKGVRYVDYQNEALTVYRYGQETGYIYSEDKNLLHELSYLLILSRAGELLDKKGIHRIHGLGLSIAGKAALCLLPMGAGKTTLALSLLKDKKIKLISDDIPLISKDGKVLPFPLRIGVNKKIDLGIPPEFLREFNRRHYGHKTLIDTKYFGSDMSGESRPWIVFIGEREFSDTARIEPISKIRAIWPFMRDGVIGLGLPQVVEYFLRYNIKDLGKISILISRMLASLKIILRSETYRFVLGQDREKNSEMVKNFLNSKQGQYNE